MVFIIIVIGLILNILIFWMFFLWYKSSYTLIEKGVGAQLLFRLFEFIFICILRSLGVFITASKCENHPFDLDSLTTTYTLNIIFAIAFLVSRYNKQQLSPLGMVMVSALLLGGVLFCAATFIQLLPHFFVVLIPLINLVYLSPLICLILLIREISELNKLLKQKNGNSYAGFTKRANRVNEWLTKYNLFFVIYSAAPFFLMVQAVLFFFGQKPDSIISQFTDSCGYLLSYQQSCSCGGDHYLCSIAANGTKKLVKPSRMGLRQNELIIVNRQLLVANAFENWLEEYAPKFHKKIRASYDACNIPVNRWSKHKTFANAMYVFMKPLEWLFLVWLYLFDKEPETRIARQYLPQKELKEFIKKSTN